MQAKTKEEIAEAYASEPWWYNVRGFMILTFAYNVSLQSQIAFFSRHIGPRHLELACGSGLLFWLCTLRLSKTASLTLLDYSPHLLAGARARFARRPNVEFVLADAAAMPLPAGSFDTVGLANAFHCLPAAEAVITEVSRVLRPNGILAMNVLMEPDTSKLLGRIANRVNTWAIAKGILVKPYTRGQVDQILLERGMVVDQGKVSGNSYDVVARKR